MTTILLYTCIIASIALVIWLYMHVQVMGVNQLIALSLMLIGPIGIGWIGWRMK